MLLLIKYTLLYGIVLMLVALGGMFSEHSGIINIALEGIMVIGGVAGVLTLTMLPASVQFSTRPLLRPTTPPSAVRPFMVPVFSQRPPLMASREVSVCSRAPSNSTATVVTLAGQSFTLIWKGVFVVSAPVPVK